MAKGIDIRATTSELLFRTFLLDNTSAKVTTGTTALRLYEVQMSDGTLKSYDFNDNTFKATATTTETASMTHRTGNNATTNTGIWTYRLATLTGFTVGNIYFASMNNGSASPTDQVREFQFGSAEGDLITTSTFLEVDVEKWLTGTIPAVNTTGVPLVDVTRVANTTQTARDLGASVLLSSGTGTGQLDFTSGVVKSNLAQILGTALTETSGLIAAAFKQFFNIGSPTGTVNLTPTTTAVTNRVSANTDQIAGSTTAATNLSTSALGIYVGTITGVSPTTTSLVDTGLGAKANDFYKDRCLVFTTGTQKYQLKDITAYTGGSDTLTFNALTGAPAQGDQYVIL